MLFRSLCGRQQRWINHISRFDFKIEYQPGAKNFLADYLSRIHEGYPGPIDINLKDPTIDSDSLEQPTSPTTPQINSNYASSQDYSTESDDDMYYEEGPASPTIHSANSIYRNSPEYLMGEITSASVTRSQKRKATTSVPTASPTNSNDSRISIGNSWGDDITLPIPHEMQRRHSEMSWMSCTDDKCEIYKGERSESVV